MIERCPITVEECPYYNQKPRKKLKREGEKVGCFSDEHHLYFPARDYETPIEKEFRNLPQNKEQLCRWEHDLAHLERDPKKPDLVTMLAALAVEEAQINELPIESP